MVSRSAVPPETWNQVLPPLVETSHWTVGVGSPDAFAPKLALWPSSTVTLTGGCVTLGALVAARTAAAATLIDAKPLRSATRALPPQLWPAVDDHVVYLRSPFPLVPGGPFNAAGAGDGRPRRRSPAFQRLFTPAVYARE